MKLLQHISLGAALIVVCTFFMPWLQVSCGGAHDSLTGIDLARNGHGSLWFILVVTAALILSALLRRRGERDRISAFAGVLCGLIVAYLMNRERWRTEDDTGLLVAQLTGWFWLGFFAALTIIGTQAAMLFQRPRSP